MKHRLALLAASIAATTYPAVSGAEPRAGGWIDVSAPINPQVTIYLNRLSDLLFVWARLCNDCGKSDVLWVPGKFRSPPPA